MWRSHVSCTYGAFHAAKPRCLVMLSPEGGDVVIVVIVALAVLVVLGAGARRTTAEHSTDGGGAGQSRARFSRGESREH